MKRAPDATYATAPTASGIDDDDTNCIRAYEQTDYYAFDEASINVQTCTADANEIVVNPKLRVPGEVRVVLEWDGAAADGFDDLDLVAAFLKSEATNYRPTSAAVPDTCDAPNADAMAVIGDGKCETFETTTTSSASSGAVGAGFFSGDSAFVLRSHRPPVGSGLTAIELKTDQSWGQKFQFEAYALTPGDPPAGRSARERRDFYASDCLY